MEPVAIAFLAGADFVLVFFAAAVLLPVLLAVGFAFGADVVFALAVTVIFAPFTAEAVLPLFGAEAVLAEPFAAVEVFALFDDEVPPLFAFDDVLAEGFAFDAALVLALAAGFFAPPDIASATATTAA